MKIVETTFERLPRERLEIGFEGENQRATVRIDCASVFAEYPNATPTLIVKPLFADAYPVVVDRNGTDVDWLITSEILSFNGDGEIQLVFYKDQVICKSAVSKIRVCRSLQVTGDMPDPVVQWIENANRKLAEVDAQIVELEGMVDTATDAATRAEQSASTASTKAEQAAGSAATATEKATEATNAAGTATAKAAEAQTAAQTASSKAFDAAESERIATAKAREATTAATTATAKAEQATGAAQTATEKAGDASASATAAHASEINAASSATAASASETAAKASETAASASATQAATSAQDAGTDAQTATQKAAEATQSATDAATFAGTATTKAEEAAASAQAASDAKTAVEQTAEQLADSLEQIEQNTQDIAELDERKANIDGYYPDMTVGNAEQLNSSKYVENSEPYTLRTSGGTSDIGNREYLDAVVGGTVAWNQMVRDEASTNETDFADIVTVDDAVEDAAGVKVKIEPVQDLHGYDHPWPAGGGINKLNVELPIVLSEAGNIGAKDCILPAGTYTFTSKTTASAAYSLTVWNSSGTQLAIANSTASSASNMSATFTISEESAYIRCYYNSPCTITNMQIEAGTSFSGTFYPYSNICPISGFDAVKVGRAGKNLANIKPYSEWRRAYAYIVTDAGLPKNTRLYLTLEDKDTSVDVSNVSLGFIDTTYSGTTTLNNEQFRWTLQRGFINPDRSNIPQSGDESKHLDGLLVYPNTEAAYDALCARYNIMVELSSESTDYSPYSGQTYTISIPSTPGTVYGGELTVNADGSGTIVQKMMYYKPNSMSDLTLHSDDTTHKLYKTVNLMPIASNIYGGSGAKSSFTNTFGNAHTHGTQPIVQFPFSTSQAYLYFRITAETNPLECEFVYELATAQTYTLSASEIRTLLGENNVWSDAGQTALTYTGTDEHLTLESGKKYLSRISGTDSMLLGSGQEITAAKGTDNVFDLTQMFGTAVADYVYGQGAAFFRKWFPKPVYPYNAGELRHVEGLLAHEMVGFNQWDEEWEVGSINSSGGNATSNLNIRSKNYIGVFPSTTYYYRTAWTASGGYPMLYYYDANKTFISSEGVSKNTTFTTPSNARFIRFFVQSAYGTTYKHDICINLAHNNSRNGEYEPYEKHSYPLDSSVILRGVPNVGANGVYWNGDRYLPDGTVERRYGVVDMGTLEWYKYTNVAPVRYFAQIANGKVPSKSPSGTGIGMCDRYSICPAGKTPQDDKTIMVGSSFVSLERFAVVVRDDDISSMSASEFKAAMNGIYLVYEIMPTTETAQPYHSTQWVSDWGTEEFVSTGIVPVGSETRYPANLRDKLQHLPDAASGNGSYLITQTDGQMVLTPFPAPPSSAGNYVLKATVVNGVATYTWEVAT